MRSVSVYPLVVRFRLIVTEIGFSLHLGISIQAYCYLDRFRFNILVVRFRLTVIEMGFSLPLNIGFSLHLGISIQAYCYLDRFQFTSWLFDSD